MVMNEIIIKTHDGQTIIINGKKYPSKVVDKWSSKDFAKLRDGMILNHQQVSKAREDSIYNAFQPYIMEAILKEARHDERKALAKMIREMPREDVIAVFTIYFDELLNMTNGDDSKNE